MFFRSVLASILIIILLSLSGCATECQCQMSSRELLSCCPKKQDDTYACCIQRCHKSFCPRMCPRGCTKQARLNELACEGAQIVELGNRVNIILYTDNCFEHGTANIDESCMPTLNNILNLIKAYGAICPPIKVTGYTDDVGDSCGGKCCLARQIADSVVAYFWTHGLDLHILCANGCGCNNPIASPHTTCGNAFNRRVEITFWRRRITDPWRQSP